MIAMHHAIFGRNPIRVNNLLTMSEGDVSTYPSKSNVSDAPISIAGFDNSVEFGDNSVGRTAYKRNYTPTIWVTYNLSFFVEMEDGGVPVVGTSNANGDFRLIINNTGASNQIIAHISGNIYRVSGYVTATTVSEIFGCRKFNAQSNRKFKISGIQLTEGADLKPYNKTT